MAEPRGKYVKHGDVEEWGWNEGHDSAGPRLNGGWVVPEGEFDPTSAPSDTTSPSEKVAEAAQSQGLRVAEEAVPEKAEPKKAEPKKAEPEKATAKK
jgi:hypothetical protein